MSSAHFWLAGYRHAHRCAGLRPLPAARCSHAEAVSSRAMGDRDDAAAKAKAKAGSGTERLGHEGDAQPAVAATTLLSPVQPRSEAAEHSAAPPTAALHCLP